MGNGQHDTPTIDLFGDLRSQFKTILADPPWRFSNSTGKVAPEHKRLARYGTMSFADIEALPIQRLSAPKITSVSVVPQRPTAPRTLRDGGLGIYL
jgi:hypothetical protein